MKIKYFSLYLLFILFFNKYLIAQEYLFVNSIGNFKDASSFSVTSGGVFYVSDAESDEIYKIDSSGNILKDAGGYGWDDGLFDDPSDIYANVLSVFVCDKNNNRVERFDKDLNYISQLNTQNASDKNMRFGYPTSCAVSQQGDLFILDSENKRIVKFDLFGNFILNFGSYDAGSFALVDPLKLALDNKDNIYVLDKNRIVLFDQYGNGLNIIKENQHFDGIQIIFDHLCVNNDSVVYSANLDKNDFSLGRINISQNDEIKKIVSSLIFNGKLYLLTPKKIYIYQKIQ